eukprot:scaffold531790_cov53-Prasinocladus_malaysianus.AAC.1
MNVGLSPLACDLSQQSHNKQPWRAFSSHHQMSNMLAGLQAADVIVCRDEPTNINLFMVHMPLPDCLYEVDQSEKTNGFDAFAGCGVVWQQTQGHRAPIIAPAVVFAAPFYFWPLPAFR